MANTFTEGLDPRELAWVTAAALPVERTTAAGRGPTATATATTAFGGDGGEARAAGRQEGYNNTHAANGTRRTEDTTVRGHQAHHAVDAHNMRRYVYYGGGAWEKGGDAHGPAVVVTSPAHGHGQGAARANGRSLAPTAPPMRSTDDGTSDVGDANTYYDARSAFHDGPTAGRHGAAAGAGAGACCAWGLPALWPDSPWYRSWMSETRSVSRDSFLSMHVFVVKRRRASCRVCVSRVSLFHSSSACAHPHPTTPGSSRAVPGDRESELHNNMPDIA